MVSELGAAGRRWLTAYLLSITLFLIKHVESYAWYIYIGGPGWYVYIHICS